MIGFDMGYLRAKCAYASLSDEWMHYDRELVTFLSLFSKGKLGVRAGLGLTFPGTAVAFIAEGFDIMGQIAL